MARPLGSENKDKPFREALRMEISDANGNQKKLRAVAQALVAKAVDGDVQAIKEIADRLDGKPAQESTVNFNDKRDTTDWTRAELVAILHDAGKGSPRAAPTNGRGNGSGEIH